MPDDRSAAAPSPSRAKFAIAGVAVLVAVYLGITMSVRAYVDTRIDRSKGRPLPAFSLPDLDGRTWTAADLTGKVTVLNFFRSKCVSCLKERDVIARFVATADPARVRVVGVMTDRVVGGISPATTRQTLARMAYRHPILMADQAFVDALHGAGWAHVTPITYIVDAKGRITAALRGHQSLESLRSAAH